MENPRIANRESQEQSLKITTKEFLDYLNRINFDAKCSYCGTGDFGVAPNPNGDSAALVATPVPNHNGLGMWLFPATCVECGYTIFFSAPMVTKAIKGI